MRPIGKKWKTGGRGGKSAQEALAFAMALKPVFDQLGLSHYSAHTAAKRLNALGIVSATGRPWSSQTVIRVLKRQNPGYVPNPKSYRFRP